MNIQWHRDNTRATFSNLNPTANEFIPKSKITEFDSKLPDEIIALQFNNLKQENEELRRRIEELEIKYETKISKIKSYDDNANNNNNNNNNNNSNSVDEVKIDDFILVSNVESNVPEIEVKQEIKVNGIESMQSMPNNDNDEQILRDMELAKQMQDEYEQKMKPSTKDFNIAKAYEKLYKLGIQSDEIQFNLNMMKQDFNLKLSSNENIKNITDIYNESNNNDNNNESLIDEEKDIILNETEATKTTKGDNNVKECTICEDNLHNGEAIQALKCMHVFHEICVQDWLDYNRICPICRYPA